MPGIWPIHMAIRRVMAGFVRTRSLPNEISATQNALIANAYSKTDKYTQSPLNGHYQLAPFTVALFIFFFRYFYSDLMMMCKCACASDFFLMLFYFYFCCFVAAALIPTVPIVRIIQQPVQLILTFIFVLFT